MPGIDARTAAFVAVCARLKRAPDNDAADDADVPGTEIIKHIDPLLAWPTWRSEDKDNAERAITACALVGNTDGYRRAKRKALTLLHRILEKGHLPSSCDRIVTIILTMATAAGNTNILGACDFATQGIVRTTRWSA